MLSEFVDKISDKSAVVGVVGLGYVGLPLASAFSRKGYNVVGLDFYLTWKASQVDMNTRFIELAGEINTAMPYHIVDKVQLVFNKRRKSLNGSSILILGVAYKPNIDDMRESPALKIIELLNELGARVLYHDPHVKELLPSRKYNFNMRSTPLNTDILKATDCVLVVTDHKDVDYEQVAQNADLIVDTRHVVPKSSGNVEEA